MVKYITARTIIIEDGKILLFFRRRIDRKTGEPIEYYSIPGGKVDEGEVPEETAVRELREELGVGVELLSPVPLAHGASDRHEHFIYYGRIVEGRPRFMEDSEEAARMSVHDDYYEMRWVPVDELTRDMMFYYNTYVPLIRDVARGKIPTETVVLVDKWV